ncbi:MAG TPA: rhodanese-like domain-containing protein [Candidatus Limnocylindrales bacterium]
MLPFRRPAPSAPSDPPDVDPPDVDPLDVARALEAGPGILLDVREPREWAAGHAPDSRHVPLGAVVAAASTLPSDIPVYVICHSGNRSRLAAELLRRQGVSGAVNVRGGLLAWHRAGLPLEA